MAQPFIDCAIKLRDKIENIEEIEKIVAQVGEGTVHRLWEPLNFEEVKQKFHANLNFAGIKKDEIAKLNSFVENVFKTKDFKSLSEINFT